MAGSSIPGYVARYGDALRRLNGPAPSIGALGTVMSGRVYDPSLSPGTAGLQQEAGSALATSPGTAATGALTPPAPKAVAPADAAGALGTPPAAGAMQRQAPKARSFWDIAKDLSDDEKDQIVKSFEDKGVDVPAAYQQAVANDPAAEMGLPKKGEDGKIDKRDMGLFLLESGLRQMQAAAQPGQTALGAFATGTLGAMEGRRGRAAEARAEAESTRRFEAERGDKAAERGLKKEEIQTTRDIAGAREKGENKRAAAQLSTQERIAEMEAVTRERAAKMAAGKDKETFTDESDGKVYWVESGDPVMVKDGKGGTKQLTGKTQEGRGDVTDKDIMAATEKHRASLDANMIAKVTIPGEGEVRWSQATDDQKNAYLSSYQNELKKRAGKKTPSGAGSSNPFDQFD